MNTDWLIAFIRAPLAVVVSASILVFFTRPARYRTDKPRHTAVETERYLLAPHPKAIRRLIAEALTAKGYLPKGDV